MDKKTIAVIFGGNSSEHEVSCRSVVTVVSNINENLYNIILIGITKDGQWLKVSSVDEIISDKWVNSKVSAVISPDTKHQGILMIENQKVQIEKVDVIFPVLHGLNGEDGTIQGLITMSKIPYVGCGVLASAVSMDKLYTKIIVDTLGIRQAKYVGVYSEHLNNVEPILE